MLRTAWFTLTEPRLPPMTRMIGLAAERWVYWRPARRSPFSSSARIGDPVSTALSSGRYLRVSGKLQQTFFAEGMQSLLARPGVISDSWIIVGT